MGKLHEPGPGEILDRLTILALKIVHGKLVGVDGRHWGAEFTALEERYGQKVDALLSLAAVNAALWQAEDTMREVRAHYGAAGHDRTFTDRHAADVGMRIQQLNDRRAELVTLINTDAGRTDPPEKL